ncbi:hypothetical protein PPERSA_02170 [Pseudocohnilembus persalinus]|uniref:Uncharacterized protein n=1 Tax=Pseudocohnilembus persalinus TaxID=266149 RepID=A0A0V0QFU5_PSEPJ|nr:hypothetical protein PPERSA_02170 [Pseudocohnilembus persalinus]|eukprot:KRX01074.1 hypothetical protein PPERSA_02170 [Pseudocohnilembus persalinus]
MSYQYQVNQSQYNYVENDHDNDINYKNKQPDSAEKNFRLSKKQKDHQKQKEIKYRHDKKVMQEKYQNYSDYFSDKNNNQNNQKFENNLPVNIQISSKEQNGVPNSVVKNIQSSKLITTNSENQQYLQLNQDPKLVKQLSYEYLQQDQTPNQNQSTIHFQNNPQFKEMLNQQQQLKKSTLPKIQEQRENSQSQKKNSKVENINIINKINGYQKINFQQKKQQFLIKEENVEEDIESDQNLNSNQNQIEKKEKDYQLIQKGELSIKKESQVLKQKIRKSQLQNPGSGLSMAKIIITRQKSQPKQTYKAKVKEIYEMSPKIRKQIKKDTQIYIIPRTDYEGDILELNNDYNIEFTISLQDQKIIFNMVSAEKQQ